VHSFRDVNSIELIHQPAGSQQTEEKGQASMPGDSTAANGEKIEGVILSRLLYPPT
jgi:hypothetical protein